MKGKIFVLAVGVFILASSHLAGTQETAKTTPRIGFISAVGAPGKPSRRFEVFRKELINLGYVEGENVLIERRYALGRLDQIPPLVNELVQQKVDVIMATNNVAIRAAKKATKTVPIVMISSIDPVEAGYVESFARPGGNITGLAHLGRDLSAKRVELLKEVLPKLSRLAVLWDKDGPGPTVAFKKYTAAARAFKLELRSLEVRGPNADLARAFQAAKTSRTEALIVVSNPLMAQHRKEIFRLAIKYRLPSMTERSGYVEAGGLMSYGANVAELYRLAVGYVVEILKGEKPADLPVMLPEKFETFINLKTAHQLGLVIPKHVLVRAHKVIQ